MARPAKIKVDYFPHMTHSGKTITILEARWGNDGYAFWFKLLELLGDSNDFVFNCTHSADWEYLLSKTRLTEPVARAILDKLAEIEAIDAECWTNKIVWSDNFVKNLESVFVKRKQELPLKPGFNQQKLEQNVDQRSFGGENSTDPDIIPTQIDKLKETKPNENKGEQQEAKQRKLCPSSLRSGVVQQADTVYLTPDELAQLCCEFGDNGAQRMLEILDAYKTNNPEKSAKYRDDFKVVRSWVIRRFQEELDYAGQNKRASPAATHLQKTFIDKLADMAVEEGL